jgi:hypothetical protein
MTVKITIIGRVDGDETGVIFDSPAGRCRGRWCGDGPVPESGEFNIELSCDEDLTWGAEVGMLAEPAEPSLSIDEGEKAIRVVGTVDSFAEDVVWIRVGGTFLAIGVSGRAPALSAGAGIEALVQVLELYPYLL